ncbi:MAG: GNAT family N-acetyltransferase [Candidatus Micrarchaeia archaeon]
MKFFPLHAGRALSLSIGRMRRGEAASVLALIRSLFGNARVSEQALMEKDRLVLVARAGRRVVGFADARIGRRSAFINGLGVAPAFEGLGLGGVLLECAASEARSLGLVRVRLVAKAANTRALSFYQAHGFVLARERKQGTMLLERRLAT